VVIGLLALGNINYKTDRLFFFVPIETEISIAIPFLGFAVLGVFAGVFYALFVRSFLKKSQDEEEILEKEGE
jgi:H+/Cl- antiporter ClcA